MIILMMIVTEIQSSLKDLPTKYVRERPDATLNKHLGGVRLHATTYISNHLCKNVCSTSMVVTHSDHLCKKVYSTSMVVTGFDRPIFFDKQTIFHEIRRHHTNLCVKSLINPHVGSKGRLVCI